jgi:hypothetical protein
MAALTQTTSSRIGGEEMNIQELKTIINSGLPEDIVKSEIINSLARDENIIPVIMRILERERKVKKEIHDEMNTLLSKAHIGLDDAELNKDGFMQKEIIAFYTKYKGAVGHCFKNLFGDKNW